jgi:formylmethanofuran--tetrahydromethanopterin N-formyltransferase
MAAATGLGRPAGLLRISAGNYGGKLGPYHFHLHSLAAAAVAGLDGSRA